MTLDEAIKNEEEIAIQQIEHANALDDIPLFGMSKDDIEEIKECYKCSKEHEQLAEWLKDYKRLLEQTRWIPVSERLPELVARRRYTEDVLMYDGADFRVGYFVVNDKWVTYGDDDYEPIAWMPLPEPYKASPTGAESEVEE